MQSPQTKSMANRPSCIMTLVVALFAAMSHAEATILSVDLNGARAGTPGTTYAANGVLRADGSAQNDPSLGTPTGIWNGIVFSTLNSPSPSTGLLDSSGQATGVSLSFANWTDQDNAFEVPYAYVPPNPTGNAANMPLLNDYLIVYPADSLPTPTMTISGLDVNSPYTLYVYGSNGGAGAGGTWSVNGSATQVTTGSGSAPFASFTQGNDYAVFSVNSDAQGRLVLSGSSTVVPFVILNGFQLTPVPVPEPATWAMALAGLAAGGLMIRRRRRQHGSEVNHASKDR